MRQTEVYLTHILEQTEIIQKITAQTSYEEFVVNPIYLNAMARCFEIIGEAAKHVPEEFRQSHSDIEWRGMTGFRDKLIHGYFSIDTVYLWEIAVGTVPELQRQIREILVHKTETDGV